MGNWKAEYKLALAMYLLKNGDIYDKGEERRIYYGYISREWEGARTAVREALESGVIDPLALDIQEDQWSEFHGTFADSNYTHGVSTEITLDGKTYVVRLDETISDILLGMLME